jgi:hypothetical protein
MQLYVQSMALVALGLLTYVVSNMRRHSSPRGAVSAIIAKCDFDAPRAYSPIDDHSPLVKKWCLENKPEALTVLLNHLRIHCKGDVCMAPEFGSNVAVAYLPERDLVIINPELAHKPEGATMTVCEMGDGNTSMYPSSVVMSFLDDSLKAKKMVFNNRASCMAHVILRYLNN